ncbi:MAG: heavy metal efflux pump, CzcA family [Bacteroidetes bacterium]|nr:heavy metal efflux pump, CzcA family [Bacteroidota bacterium]MBM2840193.1 heavy metal efflux pump, CzcA family [Bacteroidota bacterium]
MINKLIDFALKQRLLVVAATILVAAIGIYSLNNIPIDAFPDVTNIQVQVIAEAPGYSPVEVEKLVTFPIEVEMNGLPRLTEVRSISKYGLAVVTVVFEDGVDIYFARQLVLERLQKAKESLPSTVPQPEMGPIASGMGEIYQYFLESDSLDIMGLRSIQDWIVKPQLRTVPGVTEVNSFGGLVKQYHIIVDPNKLLSYNITLDEVFEAVEKNNSVAGGNYLEHASEQYIIRGIGLANKEEDFENIVVTNEAGTPIYIRNVARVMIGPEIRQGAVVMQGRGEVSAAIVMMLRGENSQKVIQRVKAKVEEINKSLPPHVKIHPYYDQTDLVQKTITTVKTNLLEGGLLIIVILLLFLGDIRAALIVASTIPLSMLFAFIGMQWLGLTANLMSLGAIDFGMIVDGSVVMVENFARRLTHKESNATKIQSIAGAAQEVGRPILFGILIIIAVYIPIMTLQGIEGKMFKPMALTVGFALVGSLLLTLTFIPVLSSFLLKEDRTRKEPRVIHWIRTLYTPLLEKALKRKLLVLGIALFVLIGSFALVPFLGSEFIPELDEGSILIQPIRMPSISLTESIEIEKKVQQVIMQFPEVEFVVGRLGRPDIATDPMGINLSDIYVTLKPKSEWKTAETKEELVKKMVEELKHVPGVNYNITQPIAMRVDELVSGVKSDVAIKLFGDELTVLKEKAERIAEIVRGVPGASDVATEQVAGQTYLNIYIDRGSIARYGLNVTAVQRIIEIAIGGKVATEVIEGQARYGVLVRYPESIRGDIQGIANTLVSLPKGGTVPLSQIATITAEEGPVQVSREYGQRRIVVECNVRGTDIGTFVAAAKKKIEASLNLPAGYYITWGGQFEHQESATNRLLVVVPLSIFIIFVLLFTTFGNLRHTMLILLNLPFALCGGVVALLIRDLPLSVSASIGFIALFGVAVLNGVVMISYINQLLDEGHDLTIAIIKGSSDRLRPVLMTALVASFGFIPMALSHGTGAEVQRPLATVVIGGLITSTLLTLFVLPTVYQWVEKRRVKIER